MQVLQTQLLPITILPIQTVPMQTLPPIQAPQGQVPASNNTPSAPTQQQKGTNQSQTPSKEISKGPNDTMPSTGKKGTNQSQTPSKENSKGPNETMPSTGSPSVGPNKQPKGKEAPAAQTPNSNPTLPSPSSKGLSNPVTSQATAKATEGKKPPKASNPKKQQNANSNSLTSPTTPPPKNKNPNPESPAAGTAGTPAQGMSSTVKPNTLSTTKSSQKPQVVMCQIICGSDCCSPVLKQEPTKSTPKTKPTTLPPTSAKSKLTSKPTVPVEVIVAPPVPMRYPHIPVWFPHRTHHPLPVGLMPRPLPFSDTVPVYMTLPPVTPSPIIEPKKEQNEPLLIGKKYNGLSFGVGLIPKFLEETV